MQPVIASMEFDQALLVWAKRIAKKKHVSNHRRHEKNAGQQSSPARNSWNLSFLRVNTFLAMPWIHLYRRFGGKIALFYLQRQAIYFRDQKGSLLFLSKIPRLSGLPRTPSLPKWVTNLFASKGTPQILQGGCLVVFVAIWIQDLCKICVQNIVSTNYSFPSCLLHALCHQMLLTTKQPCLLHLTCCAGGHCLWSATRLIAWLMFQPFDVAQTTWRYVAHSEPKELEWVSTCSKVLYGSSVIASERLPRFSGHQRCLPTVPHFSALLELSAFCSGGTTISVWGPALCLVHSITSIQEEVDPWC